MAHGVVMATRPTVTQNLLFRPSSDYKHHHPRLDGRAKLARVAG